MGKGNKIEMTLRWDGLSKTIVNLNIKIMAESCIL